MPSFHVQSFGCRSSQADGDSLAAELARNANLCQSPAEQADVVIVNTCAVTAEAESSARAYLRKVRRGNPAARLLVTGCYAQRAPAELRALPGVAAVVGNSHKGVLAHTAAQLAEAVPAAGSFVPLRALTLHDNFAHLDLATLPLATDPGQRTRPHLRAQDGCGHRCSFCIIPTTRGPSRSVPLAALVGAARDFADGGGVELVLTGINLGRWGRDLSPSLRLEDLVRALLEETSLPRLRLSSVEPMDWSDDLLALFARHATGPAPRLARHAHLPLQSGADAILRRMHRRYRPWHYAERVGRIRRLLPHAAIGADVMVGFPGETEALFEESYNFLAALPLTYLHLFPFSPRPGTAAAGLPPVPAGAVRERMAALAALAREKARGFWEAQSGQVVSAVTLGAAPGAPTEAVSDHYLRLQLPGPMPANRLVNVRIPWKQVFPEERGNALTGHGQSVVAEWA